VIIHLFSLKKGTNAMQEFLNQKDTFTSITTFFFNYHQELG